jgi:FkbM family methyltransferase
MNQNTHYYSDLHKTGDIPVDHRQYLIGMRDILNIQPRVIYDIGAAVLHWTRNAKITWPAAQIFAFDALVELEEFYTEFGIAHHIATLSDQQGRQVTYYAHPHYLGGNSYYKENEKYSPAAPDIYDKNSERLCLTDTIDNVVTARNFPLPDLIKFDVQGAELDILRGMPKTLKSAAHIIVELQHVEYNIGAKLLNESLPFIESLGFKLQPPRVIFPGNNNNYFCGNGPDADYHFVRI